jgi:hypothetical protein
MAVILSALGGAAAQFFDNNGVILSGGKIYTYVAGTTTPRATYTSATGVTPHTNPIILDSAGRVPGGEIWLTQGLVYKFVIETSTGVLIGTYDNIPNTADSGVDANTVAYTYPATGAINQTVQTKLDQYLSVADFGAVGDGVTDDTAAIQAATAAIPSDGGEVFFPEGDYFITDSIRPKSNTTLRGEGRGSRVKCASVGWELTSTDKFGLVNVKNVSNVRITGLCLYGTKLASNTYSPKLVFFENAINLTIDTNYLENSAWEGIWSGGPPSASRRILISNNHVENVGWPAAGFIGLPAIQPNCFDVVVTGNSLYNVGGGIGPAAVNIVITNNLIRDITLVGISTGDGNESGITTISNNVIEYTADAVVAKRAIQLSGGTGPKRIMNCSGNVIRVVGAPTVGNGRGIFCAGGENVTINSNSIEIEGRGVGIEVLGTPDATTAFVTGNVVRVVNESGTSSGIIGLPNVAGNTLNIISRTNAVYGLTRANSSYAYDFRNTAGATLNATIQDDLMSEGSFRLGDVNVADGSFDNIPIYLRSDYTTITEHVQRPRISMLNIQPALGGSNYVIAAGVLTITGTVASANKNLSRINVETEGAAATDDLDTISGGVSGDILILAAVNSARTVVCKDGTGNMALSGDFSLNNTEDRLVLMYEGTTWFELSRSDNGA